MTTPLWGVGSTPPYGQDARSINLKEVILRHGGEAERINSREPERSSEACWRWVVSGQLKSFFTTFGLWHHGCVLLAQRACSRERALRPSERTAVKRLPERGGSP